MVRRYFFLSFSMSLLISALAWRSGELSEARLETDDLLVTEDLLVVLSLLLSL